MMDKPIPVPGAACFQCGQQLVLRGAYEQCPEHGRAWFPWERVNVVPKDRVSHG